MKAAIVGYGRMGHEVERVLTARGHEVAVRVDPAPGVGDTDHLEVETLRLVDVAIEFSLAAGVAQNASVYGAARVAAVVGTTGLSMQLNEIRALIASAGTGYLYGTNFAVGAHLFLALVEAAAGLLNPFPDYDVALLEVHHNKKKDSPSGTALTAADRVLRALPRKTKIVTERFDREPASDEFHVASARVGAVPGTHSLFIDSASDTIEITHTARNRAGFATGAVLAAEWVVGRRGFYTVEDFIDQILSNWR